MGDHEFDDAKKWFGLIMTINDFKKFIWSSKEDLSDNSILFVEKYDKGRRISIKFKVEKNIRINGNQLEILDYYITTKGGCIAWVKADARLVNEIHKRAQKSALKDFRTTIFVPKVARDRKGCIDRLLMGYKKQNGDFRYLVRNGERDLKVLIKRISEGERTPYRELSLNVLGRLSPLKTKMRAPPEETDETKDGFTKNGSAKKHDRYVPKDQIHQNITAILDGFDAQTAQEKREREQKRGY